MIKETIRYTDFEGNPAVEEVYFHISKPELMDNLDLKDEFEKLLAIAQEEPRALTEAEVKEVLNLVKRCMKLAYGVRSADGKRFRKAGVWEEFEETAVYEEFLFSLFKDIERAFVFILSVMPKDLQAEASEMARKDQPELFSRLDHNGEIVVSEIHAEPGKLTELQNGEIVDVKMSDVDDRPAWERENREPTNQELIGLPKEKLIELMAKKKS